MRGVDGTRLHTEVHRPEDAPTVVLVHGILCSTQFWRNQIRDLSGEFRVVAYDHRGHGRSDAPRAGSYGLDDLADDLQRFSPRPYRMGSGPSWPGIRWAASR